jgi:carbamoyl-phosphate synthase small subunit
LSVGEQQKGKVWMKAILVLSDGTAFEGEGFGASGEVVGEVVFNTSMTGYQEILSDPSYRGQMVTMTYPMIGNYGVNEEDVESKGLFLSGLIVKEFSKNYSNWRGVGSLDHLMQEHNVLGISDLDTRALTRRLRDKGAMNGIISTLDFDVDSLLNKLKDAPTMEGSNYVTDVTCADSWVMDKLDGSYSHPELKIENPKYNLLAFDYGVKHNILRSLVNRGCKVTVVPAESFIEKVEALQPDGILLSNGPGDPAALPEIVATVKQLIGKLPIFGICLGHQILSLAFGGKTFKMPFGHHGGNHPVKNLHTGKVEITSQNHGFTADPDSFPAEIEITHTSLFDGTVEGMRHRELPIFSVQYHPEAAPGPHDSEYLFDQFIAAIDQWKKAEGN